METKNSPKPAASKTADEIRELSKVARSKGVGNTDFGSMRKITVTVSPSSICRAYAKELYESMAQTIAIENGNPYAELPFTELDLYVYLAILIRERIVDVRKGRTIFPRSDSDIKIPHFFYLMLASLGDVMDELQHVWLEAVYDEGVLKTARSEFVAEDQNKADKGPKRYRVYKGEGAEREFCYSISKFLTLLERYGFVNGTALPRGLTGDLHFMLFVWVENRLEHSMGDVEPGTAVLASLLSFSRDTSILNPYISYGGDNVHRILLKDVTTPRGKDKAS